MMTEAKPPGGGARTRRLAVITTHPIQYYAPWFRVLAREPGIELRVFYLWDFGMRATREPEFGIDFQWDLDLLDGYAHEFVPNTAKSPGTSHFGGLRNPGLKNAVARWRPDAVLLIGYNHASMLDFILRWRTRRAPLLFRGDSHRLGAGARGPKERLRRFLLSAIFRRFAGFLAVGQANADYFRWHGVSDAKIFFAPHAVDNDRFRAGAQAADRGKLRASLGIGPDTVMFLFAGKLVDKKRPGDLLEAFIRMRDADAALVFAGEGPLRGELEQRAASAGVPARFIGFQNQTALPSIYAAADALVLPSMGRWETWGLVVNEAMACGVPCIVSADTGCARDLIRPGETGWVFPAGDVEALEICLREAAGDSARRSSFGRNAAKLVGENYNYQRACEGAARALESITGHVESSFVGAGNTAH